MKKTGCIHLALITAALAACNKPAYWRSQTNPEKCDSIDFYLDDTCVYDPDVDLWRYSFEDFLNDYYYYYPTSYYNGELPKTGHPVIITHHPAIVRGGFGKTLAVAA
jgi:hypothetical protein